jgi:ABC-type phosphate/phosphonate transport system substrate-binding protein
MSMALQNEGVLAMKRNPGLLSLTVMLASAGCQSHLANIGQESIHIGSTKMGVLLLPAEYRALHPELEKIFDQPVLFDPHLNGRLIGKQLAAGRLEYAFLSSREYAEIPEGTRMELVCSAINAEGRTARKALIVAKSTSDVQTLADCRGQRFAFGPEGDLLLDHATVAALKKAGVAVSDLRRELPPLSLTGRLHAVGGSGDVAKAVAFDLTIPCGVVDEITFKSLPETGGSMLSGPSRDQFRVLGETEPVPEMVVVAGPKADPAKTLLLKNFLIARAKENEAICQQMGVAGFAEPDAKAYAESRKLTKTE